MVYDHELCRKKTYLNRDYIIRVSIVLNNTQNMSINGLNCIFRNSLKSKRTCFETKYHFRCHYFRVCTKQDIQTKTIAIKLPTNKAIT